MMDFFSPEWRGKRLHDIEIQSATWTTNPEVLRLFHKVALKVGLILPWLYSAVSLSLPGLSAILIFSLPFFLYVKPILMLNCTYNSPDVAGVF